MGRPLGLSDQFLGAGEMAQRLRALTDLPEVLSSNPSNHMVAHNRCPLLVCLKTATVHLYLKTKEKKKNKLLENDRT